MVNASLKTISLKTISLKNGRFLWVLAPCAVVLILAAWLRGAEYDEQYTLFLTAGVPRPDWPVTAFPAGLARALQSGRSGLARIGHDLRVTDVHPPLYFWLVSLWRGLAGEGLFAARLLSVLCGLGSVALIGVIARRARVPAVPAMLLTVGCYGFTYTSVIARGFALAHLLLLGGVACLMVRPRVWRHALAGALFGAATLTNYLSVFVAAACLGVMAWEALLPDRAKTGALCSVHPQDPPPCEQSRPGACPDQTNPSPVIPRLDGGIRTSTVPREITRSSRGMTGKGDDASLSKQCSICVHLCSSAVPRFLASMRKKMEPQMNTDEHRCGSVGQAAPDGGGEGGCHDGRGALPAFLRRRAAVAAVVGFLAFIPADLWWFLAQRGSREGQFPPFSLLPSLGLLARQGGGAILGGLPLYVEGVASLALAGVLGGVLLGLAAWIVWRWRGIGIPRARVLFGLAAVAPAVGLLGLGAVFDNTPIELRYLAFSTPFVALLLAGALGGRAVTGLLIVQTASLAGLMLAPSTMQPARETARDAAALTGEGVVALPRGNDGVGVVGAFAIEAPPDLLLLVIAAGETPEGIRLRLHGHRRVVLALMEQDDASRAAVAALRAALGHSLAHPPLAHSLLAHPPLAHPAWREVARTGRIAVYERIGGE